MSSRVAALPTSARDALPPCGHHLRGCSQRGLHDAVQHGGHARHFALSGTDANSGNSQFFINLGDNATTLDPGNTASNPAFTVFGKIVGQTSTTSISSAVVNKLTSEPTPFDTSLSSTNVFAQIPLVNYTGTAAGFPGNTKSSNLEIIKNVQIIKQGEAARPCSLVSNTNPDLVSVSFQNEKMTLNYAKNKTEYRHDHRQGHRPVRRWP